MLDPQARALLDLIVERGVPPMHTLSPDDARRLYRERRFFTQPDPPDVALVRELADGPVPMRHYRPLASRAEARLPAMVYFHGGGWTIGDRDTHDVLCRQLANSAACAVVSVDYRMGPEHGFPAAVDDAVAATRWVRANAEALALDADRLAVGGDSAGGNLAAVVCIVIRETGEPLPSFQLLIYPATDQRMTTPSHQTNGDGYLLTRDTMNWFRANYTPQQSQWTDWRASPLLAPSLAGLPPALVLTAGFDPLRDEGRQYADALSAAGGKAQCICFERQIHGFILMGRVIDEANTAVDLCAAALRRALRT
jgi:acetyl esterase